MSKITIYLLKLSSKYMFINLLIISIFIMFLNLIELSRVLGNNESLFQFTFLSLLKLPSILNQIIPFVTIISIAFLLRSLISNNELVSMRNIGYSVFDIFFPIGITIFIFGLFFLIILNPIASNFESKYEKIINTNDQGLYSINISNNEMWIKNKVDENFSIFINIRNIDLKDMTANDIKIVQINREKNIFILAKNGVFKENIFLLKNVKYYDIYNENFEEIDKYELKINFNKKNIINSIENFKLIPFYNYITHTKTLEKFNLYSPEIGLYYLSEILKPVFIVALAFVIFGFSAKFKRNENFFKVLFISILIGFLIFLLKEIVTKLTISLSINFLLSYMIIFFIPLSIGLYQVIKLEND